nr:PREDICTED: uncharacterized protein LOC105664058 [Megachile rotundata]
MFHWMKHRQIIEMKNGMSTASLSSTTDLEVSLHVDSEESFVKKFFDVSAKKKQISRRLISVFQKKSKEISTNKKKNQSSDSLLDDSTNSLLNDSTDKIEDSFREEETKLSVGRKSTNKLSFLKHKRISFRKKSSNNHEKKYLQISGSSREVAFNEDDIVVVSSPIIKAENPLQASSKLENNGVIVRRKPMSLSFNDPGSISIEGSPSPDDKSSFFHDSGICGTESDSLSDETDVLEEAKSLKIDRSSDCIKICDKCTTRHRERECIAATGLEVENKSQSANCVASLMKSPIETGECFVDGANDSGNFHSSKFDRLKSVIKKNEESRSIGSNNWRRRNSWMSKSAVDLCSEDSIRYLNEVTEFISLDDFLCSGLLVDSENCGKKCGASVEDANTEVSDEKTEVQTVSLQIGCENDGESDSDNYNASYVITMYV